MHHIKYNFSVDKEILEFSPAKKILPREDLKSYYPPASSSKAHKMPENLWKIDISYQSLKSQSICKHTGFFFHMIISTTTTLIDIPRLLCTYARATLKESTAKQMFRYSENKDRDYSGQLRGLNFVNSRQVWGQTYNKFEADYWIGLLL